jgi:hypothetical protein
MSKEEYICGHDADYGWIYCDLSPKQRYVIVKLDGYFAIRDRAADGDACDHYPVQQIGTREDAEELLRRMIQGEPLEDEAS